MSEKKVLILMGSDSDLAVMKAASQPAAAAARDDRAPDAKTGPAAAPPAAPAAKSAARAPAKAAATMPLAIPQATPAPPARAEGDD